MLQAPVGNSFLLSIPKSRTAALQGDQPFTRACGVYLVVRGSCTRSGPESLKVSSIILRAFTGSSFPVSSMIQQQ